MPKGVYNRTEEHNKIISKSHFKYGSHQYYMKIAKKVLNDNNIVIQKGQVIHHLDGNYKNNELENLYIFNSNSEHKKYHHFLKDLIREELGLMDKRKRYLRQYNMNHLEKDRKYRKTYRKIHRVIYKNSNRKHVEKMKNILW